MASFSLFQLLEHSSNDHVHFLFQFSTFNYPFDSTYVVEQQLPLQWTRPSATLQEVKPDTPSPDVSKPMSSSKAKLSEILNESTKKSRTKQEEKTTQTFLEPEMATR